MFDYGSYLRKDKFPLIWCAGCGDGIVLKAMLRAIHRIGLSKDEIVMVSGIGCSSRLPGYVDFNTLHTTHGRAIAFATGVKLANSDLKVIVVTGDGDATAIGGNHYIHAARRNIDLTVVLFNNWIYGMTGGQVSPTTPFGMHASTAPYGNAEHAFNISGLAEAAGASFVARETVYRPQVLDKFIEQAIRKKGFSVVEVFTPCPTCYGRRNKQRTPVDMMTWLKDHSVSRSRAEKMSPEELQQMSFRMEIRLSGEGGQGLVLAGKVLAEAAAIYDNKNATQSQSYGPEARGGASRSEVIISDEEIDYPKAVNLDLLLALTQESCNRYWMDLKDDGILLVDADAVTDLPDGPFQTFKVPITKIAEQEVGKILVANIVALGVITGLSGIVSEEAVESAILARVPKGTEELNLTAFKTGLQAGRSLI